MARERGIKTIVDAPTPSRIFRSRSPISSATTTARVHKWLLAPVGTGFLYVRRPLIKGHWALTPANESRDADIRKFEEIGTHPAAMHNAIAEALEFHHSIGGERKAARLRYLRNRWASRLHETPGAKVLTSFDPAQGCAIGLLSMAGRIPIR